MSRAAVGKAVRFHYTGSLGDGSGSGSSIERDPLEVKLGAGQVVLGFGR
jgi:FKBP-type peptidyl-prolyl cis-trans isomerase